ncbi:MAG: alpha/beta hydrolase [Clostridia bacterium]|nr:alpha/beta hydrolase [Clostridia bacterium]
MREYLDLFYTAAQNPTQMLDLLLPDGDEFPIFVYFHGGGLEAGSRKDCRLPADYLCAHGVAVALVDYRMYPEAAYPDFLRDGAAAVAWVKKHIGEYGRCGRIYVGGGSAGAYMSMMLCFDDKYLAPYGIHPTDIAGFVHDGGQPTAHFNVLRERGLDTRRVIVDESAPLYYVGLAREYAPMLFLISDHDMECRHEQTELLRAALRHFRYDQGKIEYRLLPGTHGSYFNEIDKNGESVFGRETLRFIRARGM